ncbi:NUDIX domain-containing protein [Pseudonocardia endophytica]|uniref:ADP-ribose pyrophosphatase YjhB (NUDIX family) n=1 Tax=Pseudonocardia endophytica TaxID=401976 RepID=A0A4R1HKX2_PSEEN|nr:NUDIX hydrolase [Pseudonocardia endophytica]TCK20940.1 ADP-ribose pyrophosphatase YjhB (NUDIX family) [Pseudonocardia endophytica]
MDAHFAHLAEGNARQARKRVAADVLIRDLRGRVLLVDPTYKEGWDLPGGMVEDNESPHDGARRELAEELRLDLTPGAPLVIEWVEAHGPWDDQIVFVFDGGTLTDEQISGITIGDDEIAAWRFVDPDELDVQLRSTIRHRVELSRRSLATGRTEYREGRPGQT